MNANTPPNGPLAVRLRSITYAARDTHLYEFVRLDGQAMPDVAPGAHVDLHLPNGTVRPYSLVRAGQGLKSYVVGVKLDPKSRGGSRYIHEKLMAGTEMSLSEPRNHFPLKEDAPHTVLVAGGIGITPIWCMAQRLQAIGASWELWYSCRSRADAAFLDEMAAFGDRVHLHFDEEAGHLLDLQALVAKAAPDAHLYCCGPAPMLAAYEAAAAPRRSAPGARSRAGARRRRADRAPGQEHSGSAHRPQREREFLLPARRVRLLRSGGAARRGGPPRRHPHPQRAGLEQHHDGLLLRGQERPSGP